MEAKAIARFVRGSYRKFKKYADAVKGMTVRQARAVLEYASSPRAKVVLKTILSAFANLKYKKAPEEIDEDDVRVFVKVDTGPILKRINPRGHGRIDIKKRRYSHVTAIVKEIEEEEEE